jgi:flagellar motor switch protein FliG
MDARVMSKHLSGADKAALFLMSLGPDITANVMKKMDDESLTEIARHMPQVARLGQEALDSVHTEFENIHSQGNVMASTPEQVKEMLKQVVDGSRLQRILDSLDEAEHSRMSVWAKLSRMKPKAVFNLIKTESPQVIAIILANLKSELSSNIISLLPEDLQMSVVFRMSKIESVPRDIVRDIEEALDRELGEAQGGSGLNFDGMVRVVDILKTLDSKITKPILDHLREKDPELFEQVDSQLLMFEDFQNLSGKDMQQILKQVASEDLVKALKGASDEIREHFLGNMSQRAADILREDIEVMGPIKVSDVEKSQRTILEIARTLDEEGIITLGQQDDLVF